ncbi:MAG: hypothetical protein OEV01_08475 [Nitrospira sp.]|nr:hypothetical protein [Nitrospira sp.]
MMKLKIGLWMVVGFFGVAGFPLIAGAGAYCAAGKSRCVVENAASRLDDRAREEARKVIESARAEQPHSQPLITPINTSPADQSYGRWAAEWWQWALGVPAAVSPLTDTTGEHCAQRQVDQVWFLAGSLTGPVVRRCQVPAGKSLFFPLINIVYGAFLNDTPETRTEEFVRAAGSCTDPAQISAWIDEFQVPNPTRFFTGPSGSQSPFFNVQLPPGNIFGLDENVAHDLVLSPSAEQGYYLFVRPLHSGVHTIRWIASGCTPGNSQDITYYLTVK